MSEFARGGMIRRARQDDDAVPLLLTGGCDYLLPEPIAHDRFHCGPLAGVPIPEPHGVVLRGDEFADALAKAWRKEWDDPAWRARYVTRQIRRLLSRRTRLRLLIARIRDRAAIWLVNRRHYDAALWVWRDRRR